MGIDKAFQYAVTLAWEDFKAIKPRSIRVEYLCEPGAALNHLSVWSVRAGGYRNLVCAYEEPTSAHPGGTRFANERYSEGLGQTIDFIMQHQNQFTRPADAGRHGLVQVHPPEGDDRIEAAAWFRGVHIVDNETSRGGAPRPPEEYRQSQGEEASSRTEEQEYTSEGTATVPDTGCEWFPIS